MPGFICCHPLPNFLISAGTRNESTKILRETRNICAVAKPAKIRMIKCLTSGTGLITFERQDSRLCPLWHSIVAPAGCALPPPPLLHWGSLSPGTRGVACTTFISSQLFGLWEEGRLNGDVFLKHHWLLLERGHQLFRASDLIPCCRYSASKGSSLCNQKVPHSRCHPCDMGQEPQDSARIPAAG